MASQMRINKSISKYGEIQDQRKSNEITTTITPATKTTINTKHTDTGTDKI